MKKDLKHWTKKLWNQIDEESQAYIIWYLCTRFFLFLVLLAIPFDAEQKELAAALMLFSCIPYVSDLFLGIGALAFLSLQIYNFTVWII